MQCDQPRKAGKEVSGLERQDQLGAGEWKIPKEKFLETLEEISDYTQRLGKLDVLFLAEYKK